MGSTSKPGTELSDAESLSALGLGEDGSDSLEDLLNVTAARVDSSDAHVADTEVGRGDVLVEATGNNNVMLSELGEDGSSHALGVLDGRHAVGGNVAREGNEAGTELLELVLEVVRDLLVKREALLERDGALGDFLESSVEGVDELDGGSGKVHGAALLVGAHDGEPAAPRDVVRADGGLAVLEGLEGTLRGHDDRETGGSTETLLGGRDDNVKSPVVEADLLGRN